MPGESWRLTDVVTVPDVVGLLLTDAVRLAHDAGVVLAQPDPDGAPAGRFDVARRLSGHEAVAAAGYTPVAVGSGGRGLVRCGPRRWGRGSRTATADSTLEQDDCAVSKRTGAGDRLTRPTSPPLSAVVVTAVGLASEHDVVTG